MRETGRESNQKMASTSTNQSVINVEETVPLNLASTQSTLLTGNFNSHGNEVMICDVSKLNNEEDDNVILVEIVNSDFVNGLKKINKEDEAKEPSYYTCRICNATFPNKSQVTIHSRVHKSHKGKPFRCEYCNKGFSTIFHVRQHERIHSGQKPYRCPICDMSFRQLSHVQQHVRTHTGVRPFKCRFPGCKKSFMQLQQMKTHAASHSRAEESSSELRLFKCNWPECGKAFAQVNSLKSHVNSHGVIDPPAQAGKKQRLQQRQSVAAVAESGNPSQVTALEIAITGEDDTIPDDHDKPDDDDSAIRPFMCPHCSKVYVREVTFSRHVANCERRQQRMSDYDCDELSDDGGGEMLSDDGDIGADEPFGAEMSSDDEAIDFEPTSARVRSAATMGEAAAAAGEEDATCHVEVTQDNCIDSAAHDERDETTPRRFLRHLLRDIRRATRRARCETP